MFWLTPLWSLKVRKKVKKTAFFSGTPSFFGHSYFSYFEAALEH